MPSGSEGEGEDCQQPQPLRFAWAWQRAGQAFLAMRRALRYCHRTLQRRRLYCGMSQQPLVGDHCSCTLAQDRHSGGGITIGVDLPQPLAHQAVQRGPHVGAEFENPVLRQFPFSVQRVQGPL